MEQSMGLMMGRITGILAGNNPTVYLYGSVVLDDFKLGWSDIDILCLTESPLSGEQADTLAGLRQTMLAEHPGDPYFRLFEGGFLTWDAFVGRNGDTVAYWGTSGQRVTDAFGLDPFSMMELLEYGRLLHGPDHRDRLAYPSGDSVVGAVRSHLDAIRTHARHTPPRVNSCGWLLDIARCLYTLETGGIIAKTQAGLWALERGLAPDAGTLRRAVEIRRDPQRYGDDVPTFKWLASLGPKIQAFADVLERKLCDTDDGKGV